MNITADKIEIFQHGKLAATAEPGPEGEVFSERCPKCPGVVMLTFEMDAPGHFRIALFHTQPGCPWPEDPGQPYLAMSEYGIEVPALGGHTGTGTVFE